MKKNLLLLIALSSLSVLAMDKKVDVITKKMAEKLQLDIDDIEDSEESEQAIIPFPQVHFSPGIQEILTKFISDEQEKIRGAWFRFTLQKPAQAIADGIKKRRIKATLIVDESNIKDDFCGPLKLIAESGGEIYKKDKPRNSKKPGKFEVMHHKFMIFSKDVNDKKLVWTGSFNATGQADLKNCENAIILDDEESIAKFEEEFGIVKKHSTKLDVKQLVSPKDTATSSWWARVRMNGMPK